MDRRPVIFVNGYDDYLQWRAMPFEDYKQHVCQDSEMAAKFVLGVESWNRKYSINFFDFRAEIQQIAKRVLARVGCEIIERDKPSPINPSDVVFPTDDDDWFHPDIVKHVMPVFEKNPETNIAIWGCWIFDPLALCCCCGSGSPYFMRIDKWSMTGSNAFALSGGNWQLPIYHSYIWENYDSKDLVTRINADLSIWVRHPASLYLLAEDSIYKYHNIVQEQHVRPVKLTIPTPLMWAEAEIDRVWEMTNELLSGVKF